MSSNLPNPLMWQGLVYGDKDAFLDWLFQHQLWHQALATATKTAYLLTDDLGGAWRSLIAQGLASPDKITVKPGELLRHARMHAAEAKALGISPAYDLTGYNLNERDSFVGFHQSHALEHDRLRKAASI